MKINILYALVFIFFGLASFSTNSESPSQDFDLKASMKRGEMLYRAQCLSCHKATGQGIPSVYPPLDNSKNLKNKGYIVNVIKNGISTTTVVKGVTYTKPMDGIDLTDKEISDVVNYMSNSWGNSYGVTMPAEVKQLLKSAN